MMNPMMMGSMGGMGGMHGMGMMNPMMAGMMNGMGMGMHGFNGENSMLPSNGEVSKCQPISNGKLCAKYDAERNKLKINVKVAKSKRRKKSSRKHSNRYKFLKNSESDNPFPQYKNPFKSHKSMPEKSSRGKPKTKPNPKASTP